MDGEIQTSIRPKSTPWNKGRITGQKRPLKPKDVWAIRIRLQLEHRARDLALFNLGIDSKLRGCDLVRLQVEDVCAGGRVRDRATVIQKKTGRPVQFEITEQTRAAIQAWLPKVAARDGKYLFPSRFPGPTAPLDTAVCTHCPRMGRERWARRLRLRRAVTRFIINANG
jgi:integrase